MFTLRIISLYFLYIRYTTQIIDIWIIYLREIPAVKAESFHFTIRKAAHIIQTVFKAITLKFNRTLGALLIKVRVVLLILLFNSLIKLLVESLVIDWRRICVLNIYGYSSFYWSSLTSLKEVFLFVIRTLFIALLMENFLAFWDVFIWI